MHLAFFCNLEVECCSSVFYFFIFLFFKYPPNEGCVRVDVDHLKKKQIYSNVTVMIIVEQQTSQDTGSPDFWFGNFFIICTSFPS